MNFQKYEITTHDTYASPSIESNRLMMTDQGLKVFYALFSDHKEIPARELEHFLKGRQDAFRFNQTTPAGDILPAVTGRYLKGNGHYKFYFSGDLRDNPTDKNKQPIWDEKYKIPVAACMYYEGDHLTAATYYTKGENVSPSALDDSLLNPVTGKAWPTQMNYDAGELTPYSVSPSIGFRREQYKSMFEAYYGLMNNKMEIADIVEELPFLKFAGDSPKV